jgi:mannose-6-phosphate isomerase-like protein (cupin superfamily)
MMTEFEVVGPEDQQWFDPPGHWLVHSHWIVRGASAARVQLCEMGVGGGATTHVHEDEEQVFYVFEGQLRVEDGSGADVVVRADEALRIPAGVPHATTNPGDRVSRYLVVTSAAP